jgi:hypothetical protein
MNIIQFKEQIYPLKAKRLDDCMSLDSEHNNAELNATQHYNLKNATLGITRQSIMTSSKMTLCIASQSIMTVSLMTLRIMTLSRMTLSIMIKI